MAMPMVNVFGTPVTDETVRQVEPGLNGPITARDRARVALYHSDGFLDVLRFTFDIKRDDYGDGTATRGIIFNATGGDLTLVHNHTWEGYVWRYPYPRVLRNGQWAGFLHVTDRPEAHSKEAVVYRGTNGEGLSRDWMLAWNTHPGPTTPINADDNLNHAYTEIRESNNANGGGFDWANWYTINAAMEKQSNGHLNTSLGCVSGVSISERGSSPVFLGQATLDGIEFSAAMASHVSTISQSLRDVNVQGGPDDATPAE